MVHNAGRLSIGYAEAFTAEDIAHLLDITVLGAQRVNRAALPHMRAARQDPALRRQHYPHHHTAVLRPQCRLEGRLPFDALALTIAYEVSQFGIETASVMPGAFTRGAAHFPNARRASDQATARAYAALDPLVTRNEEATESLFASPDEADPQAVADEIARSLALSVGGMPLCSVVDFTDSGVAEVNAVIRRPRERFVTRMGFGALLELKR